MVLPLDTLEEFKAVTPVTPFTYRDTATNLTILRGLEQKLNDLIEQINDVSSSNAGGLNAFKVQVAAALAALRAELVAMVEALENESTAFDPTTGARTNSISKVIGNVYDNARVFAYFAAQFDELEQTAAEYDGLQIDARHYDLGITYPTINDVQA